MKHWFLRITHPSITRNAVLRAKIAPILFRGVPLNQLHTGMPEADIRQVVQRFYPQKSRRSQGAHIGTIKRFVCDATPGDRLAIRVNREELIFGQFMSGGLKAFPNFEAEGVKGRPFVPLAASAAAALRASRLPAPLMYRGTFCRWVGDDDEDEPTIPDEPESVNVGSATVSSVPQIKFIRVGADLKCGKRLSRIFPGGYYHFIPIPKHNDPEFCRFTYGDVGKRPANGKVATKGRSLSGLRKNDVLVFYAGFDRADGAKRRHLVGIFAYFVVGEAFLFEQPYEGAGARAFRFSGEPPHLDPFKAFDTKSSPKTMTALISQYGDWNAHFCADRKDGIDLIVCGERKQSKLLSKIEVLAEFDGKHYKVGKQTAARWGLRRGNDLKMSSVRTVCDESVVPSVLKQLKSLV